jgi:hypothetical protein
VKDQPFSANEVQDSLTILSVLEAAVLRESYVLMEGNGLGPGKVIELASGRLSVRFQVKFLVLSALTNLQY